MAITVVGTNSNSAADGGDVTVTLPVGTAENDVVYAAYSDGNGAANVDMAMVTADYAELADVFGDDSRNSNLGVFRKVMGATPDTDAVFNGSGNANAGVGGIVIVLRGVDTTTPEDATTTQASGSDGGTPTSPAIDTVTADAMVIAIIANSAGAAWSLTAPTDYTELVQVKGDDVNDGNIAAAVRTISSPGTETPGSFGSVPAGDANDAWTAVTVAVRPAAAAGTVIPQIVNSYRRRRAA